MVIEFQLVICVTERRRWRPPYFTVARKSQHHNTHSGNVPYVVLYSYDMKAVTKNKA